MEPHLRPQPRRLPPRSGAGGDDGGCASGEGAFRAAGLAPRPPLLQRPLLGPQCYRPLSARPRQAGNAVAGGGGAFARRRWTSAHNRLRPHPTASRLVRCLCSRRAVRRLSQPCRDAVPAARGGDAGASCSTAGPAAAAGARQMRGRYLQMPYQLRTPRRARCPRLLQPAHRHPSPLGAAIGDGAAADGGAAGGLPLRLSLLRAWLRFPRCSKNRRSRPATRYYRSAQAVQPACAPPSWCRTTHHSRSGVAPLTCRAAAPPVLRMAGQL